MRLFLINLLVSFVFASFAYATGNVLEIEAEKVTYVIESTHLSIATHFTSPIVENPDQTVSFIEPRVQFGDKKDRIWVAWESREGFCTLAGMTFVHAVSLDDPYKRESKVRKAILDAKGRFLGTHKKGPYIKSVVCKKP